MLFNSIDFALFSTIVFIVYWFFLGKNRILQNIFLLLASYFFYAFWDWRFLFLLIGISSASFISGILIDRYKSKHICKIIFISFIILCILVLVYFKYFNFFIESFSQLFSRIGIEMDLPTMTIILPLGISFYIFLSLSYVIDIFTKKEKVNRNIVEVLLSLSFFPIILAGPIHRPASLIKQFQAKRVFRYHQIVMGLRKILWGLFMKIVIADNCAVFTADIFERFDQYNGSTLLLGGILYTIQIYADFAGYSEIAIGTSNLLGFEIIRNFNYPYFAKDITDFWKRWHISLTLWFRDYVFLPFTFLISRKLPAQKTFHINTDYIIYASGIALTWTLTGLWHGANYTFILWGTIHGFMLVLYQTTKKTRKFVLRKIGLKKNGLLVSGLDRLIMYVMIILTWIVFRSENIDKAVSYLSKIFSSTLFNFPFFSGMRSSLPTVIMILFFIAFEWILKNNDQVINYFLQIKMKPLRWLCYLTIISLIYFYGSTGENVEFIYFKF